MSVSNSFLILEQFNDMALDDNTHDLFCLKCKRVLVPFNNIDKDWEIDPSPNNVRDKVIDHRSKCLGGIK